MSSMTRTFARNIAREQLLRAGFQKLNRKGYAAHSSKRTRYGKAFKETITSAFALNWKNAHRFAPVKSRAKKRG